MLATSGRVRLYRCPPDGGRPAGGPFPSVMEAFHAERTHNAPLLRSPVKRNSYCPGTKFGFGAG